MRVIFIFIFDNVYRASTNSAIRLELEQLLLRIALGPNVSRL